MQKLIMIKYAELNTKKDNIGMFLKALKQNITEKIGDKATVLFDKGRMFIKASDEHFDEVLLKVQKVFGIHEIMIGYETNSTDIEVIEEALLLVTRDLSFTSFKVETKRSDKNYPLTSLEISKHLGGVILKSRDCIVVDVHHPEVTINVEIRKDHAYIYVDKIKGLGGYPVGTLGKGLLMLSGGIDSPVSGYLAMKRGVPTDCVYFEAIPHTSLDARNKVIELSKKLAKYSDEIHLHVVNFTKIQEEIYKNCHPSYCITIMRRMMYRIMEKLAIKYHGLVIINGESIGQVASQTLTSMNVINEVTSMPVIRPVACFDKLEIIDLAKKIDTYDISILPYEDCCTVFVPKHPVINPSLEQAKKEESKFDFSSMIDDAVDTVNTIVVCEEENTFNDLL